MFLLTFLNFFFTNCFLYTFQAKYPYLLIEVFSQEWTELKIEVSEDQVIQSQIEQPYSQYLQMYYKVVIGAQYNLDIYLFPSDTYKITEVNSRDCPNQCSQNGLCQKLFCECFEMIAGDRCQYQIQPIYNQTTYHFELIAFQTAIIGIYLQQDDLVDDQQQIRNIRITTNYLLNSTIYFLYPFELPYKSLIDDKKIFEGTLNDEGTEIDYSDKFASYHIKSANYSFLLVVRNPFSWSQQYTIQYKLLDNDTQFQDFILVIILSVVSFIILLVIIYIVKKRCQYMQENKTKDSDILQSQKGVLSIMGVVSPAKDQECIICLDPLDQKTCRQTPCKHILHEECLKQWLIKQQNCPICRENFVDEDGFPKTIKVRNQTTTLLNNQISQLVQSDRNSVRSMILMRSRQSRLAVFQ